MAHGKANTKLDLGTFEELVLLAVARLGTNAYGVTIWELVQRAEGHPVVMGAIYTTLDRLQDKGFVSSRQGEATAQRGGRPKRYFMIEGAGQAALDEAERRRNALRYAGPHTAGGAA